MTSIPLTQWPRLLAALPAVTVKQLAAELILTLQVEDLIQPQAGLGLLQLRDGAINDAFFLGEIPLTRAHVRISNPAGQQAEGAVQLMDDRVDLVRAMAVLDGILAGSLPGAG